MQSWNTASFSLFLKKLAIRCEKKKKISGSGRVRALNLTVPLGSGRVGSDDLGYGPGSVFSLKPVQTSSLHHHRPHYCISPTAEALQAAWEEAEEG